MSSYAVQRSTAYRTDNQLFRNCFLILLFNFVWAIGIPLTYEMTILPAFFQKMGAHPIVYSLLQVSVNLPVFVQIIPRFSRLNLRSSKTVIFGAYTFCGIGYIVFGLVAPFTVQHTEIFVPCLLLLLFFIFAFYQLASILYFEFMSRVIPINLYGRLFGLTGVVNSAGSILGSFILGFILRTVKFPMTYGVLFAAAGVLFILSSLSCLFMQEKHPEQIEGRVSENFIVYLRSLKPLITKKIVIVYAVFTVFILVNQLPSGFFYPYLRTQTCVTVNLTTITFVTFLSQAVLLPILGICLDKCGRMRTITIYISMTLLSLIALLSQLSWGYYAVFILYGMYGLFISMIKARLSNECVSSGERMDTVIIINIAGVLLSTVLSLVYGMIAQCTGKYSSLFILTLVVMIGFFPTAWLFFKLLEQKSGQA
ncbi:MAG: hypothetical protein LBS53_05785 [Synergistaceae bacterium]|jgi:MFS family permease|nr:hypothetical protein [Synergistaceae bacterium]